MKRIFYIAAMAAMLFTACEKNGDPTNSDNREVSFAIDEVVTRVTTTSNSSVFENNDVVKINSFGLEADLTNIEYKVNGNSLVYNGNDVAPKLVYNRVDGVDLQASFVAHYPSDVDLTSNVITMTVDADQSTEDNFHDQMLMIATSTGDPDTNNGVVSFKFKHQMAMVKINVTVPDGVTVSSVTLDNVKSTVTWTNGETTPLGDAAGDEISVLPWRQQTVVDETSTNLNEWWALIPAQTINGGTALITIATNKGTYGYTLPAAKNVKFTNAKTQIIKLNLEKDKVNADFSQEDDIDPDNWGSNGEDISGDLTYQPVVLISEEQGNFSKVTLQTRVTGVSNVITPNAWTPIIAQYNGTDRGTVTVNASSLDIVPAEGVTDNKWYNLGVAYRIGQSIKPATYILKYDVEATVPEGKTASGLLIATLQPSVTGGNIRWAADKTVSTYTQNQTSELVINSTPNKRDNGVSQETESSLNNGLLIVFGVNASDDVTYKISNVSLIEKAN